MSKHETPLTRRYWKTVGGTLVHEFPAVKRSSTHGGRWIDAVLVVEGSAIEKFGEAIDVDGKDIIIVQTKARRLGMNLLRQAFLSRELLLRHFSPASVRTVAVCTADDDVLAPIANDYSIEVLVMQR